MKYTEEQIRGLSILEWTGLMAKELNEKGFIKLDFDIGTQRTVQRPYKAIDNLQEFLYSEVNRWDEIEHLKKIGLLNNGRCSLCGKPLKQKPMHFHSPNELQQNMDVCNKCGNKDKKGNGAGLTILLALAILSFVTILAYEYHIV